MSLSELCKDKRNPWASIRCENITVDDTMSFVNLDTPGDLTVQGDAVIDGTLEVTGQYSETINSTASTNSIAANGRLIVSENVTGYDNTFYFIDGTRFENNASASFTFPYDEARKPTFKAKKYLSRIQLNTAANGLQFAFIDVDYNTANQVTIGITAGSVIGDGLDPANTGLDIELVGTWTYTK